MEATLPLFLFWLKKVVSALILPPLFPFMLVFLGLVLLWRRKRGGFAIAWIGIFIGILSTLPAAVNGMLLPLEPKLPLQRDEAKEAQAIVILGGGRHIASPEYGSDIVGSFTLERLRYGARLARETALPVLVSGGAPSGAGLSEAALMKATLEEDFNVPVRWAEEASLDTRQNAHNSAAMLKAEGIRHVILVTHAFHMRRARLEFESQGLTVSAAPTVWLGNAHSGEVLPQMPAMGSAFAGYRAMREWLGLLARRLGS